MGHVYRPALKSGEKCSVWWAQYYVNGQRKRESTGTESEQAALRFLKKREGEAVTGQPILPRVDKVLYTTVRDDLRTAYAASGARDLVEVDKRLAHLDPFFGTYRAVAITRPTILKYATTRQAQGAANGTINRELSVLGTMLRHAVANNQLVRLPDLRKLRLREADPRSGFFEAEQFEWVRKRLPEDLQAAVTIMYTYGWRVGEVLALEKRHVDVAAGTLTLDPGMTKTRKPRIVYMTPEVRELVAAQLQRVAALETTLKRIVPFLFPYLPGTPHVNRRLIGTRRKDFRKQWLSVCEAAGVPGMLRHDFRRTAARNMVRAGIPETVAMKITGHRSRNVFDRYNITSGEDLQNAAAALAAARLENVATSHVLSHVRRLPVS